MKYKTIVKQVEAFKWTGGPDQIEDPVWAIDAIDKKLLIIKKDGFDIYSSPEYHSFQEEGFSGDYIIKLPCGALTSMSEDEFNNSFTIDKD